MEGDIDKETEIIEENNYYPFGLKHKGYNEIVNAETEHKFRFNSTEFDTDFDLNWYNMPLRHQDPTTGRWNGIDPVTHFSSSTYASHNNNPVFWADPSGACGTSWFSKAFCTVKTGIGVALGNPNVRKGVKGAMRLNQARKFFNGGGNKGGRVFTAGNQMAWLDARAEAAAGGVSGGGNVSVSSVPAIIIGGIKAGTGTVVTIVKNTLPLIKLGGQKLWDGTKFLYKQSHMEFSAEYSHGWKNFAAAGALAGTEIGFTAKEDVTVNGVTIVKRSGEGLTKKQIMHPTRKKTKEDKGSLSIAGYGLMYSRERLYGSSTYFNKKDGIITPVGITSYARDYLGFVDIKTINHDYKVGEINWAFLLGFKLSWTVGPPRIK